MSHLIDLVSVEGGTLKINRFFLQLHNTFFHSLLLEHQHEDLVIIFSDTEISELKALKKSVLEKHILCASFDLSFFKKEVSSSKEVNVDNGEDKIDIFLKPNNVIKATVSAKAETPTDKPDENVSQDINLNPINAKETRQKALKFGKNCQEK